MFSKFFLHKSRSACSFLTIQDDECGFAECSASIGIQKKRPMAKPAFLSEIAPITVTEGESLETKVIITGDPTPFAKWYINDQVGYLIILSNTKLTIAFS